MACVPPPTTLILANVCAETRDLKSQKIQERREGTLMKYFLYCEHRQSRLERPMKEERGTYEELGVMALERASCF